MKTCSQCKQDLPLEFFTVQSTGKQGRRADCKACQKRFIRTKHGLIKEIYALQKSKSKTRGYTAPAYSEEQLLTWAMNEPGFHLLFTTWKNSGYLSKFKPSVDRLDDLTSYRFGNIQLLTWAENSAKGYASQKQGTNNKKNLAVDMLDLTGTFLRRFHSTSEAARKFNGIPSNIIGAINHRVSTAHKPDGTTRTYIVTTAYGHRWRYSNTPNDNSEIP